MASRNAVRSAIRTAVPRQATASSARSMARSYATGSSTGGGSKWPLYGALGLGAAGLGYYFVAFDSQGSKEERYKTVKDASKTLDYQQVYKDIVDVLESESYDDGSYGPVLVRLAW